VISQIRGEVIEVGDASVTVLVGELAYEVLVPSSVLNATRRKLNDNDGAGSSAGAAEPPGRDTFYTIQYIEGSSGHGNQFFRLVGFNRKIEKDFFLLYTGVEGIGYRTALRSLVLPIQKIALAIERGDVAVLKTLPHIGARTAEKMVATLKGRMQKFALDLKGEPLAGGTAPASDLESEIRQVLRQVGYSDSEAARLLQKALQSGPAAKSSEELIQRIFRIRNSES